MGSRQILENWVELCTYVCIKVTSITYNIKQNSIFTITEYSIFTIKIWSLNSVAELDKSIPNIKCTP